MRTNLRTAAVVAVALLAVAGCGDDDGDDGTTATTTTAPTSEASPTATDTATATDTSTEAAGGGLTIRGFAFAEVPTVAPGEEVTAVNEDDASHTVTADDGAFDTGGFTGETTFTAPDEPGTYAFHCEIHPNMTAELTVEG